MSKLPQRVNTSILRTAEATTIFMGGNSFMRESTTMNPPRFDERKRLFCLNMERWVKALEFSPTSKVVKFILLAIRTIIKAAITR